MRNAILVSILTVVLVVSAAAVYAGPPVSGTYKSTNLQFDEGTATTKWAGTNYLGAGNVLYGRSYAGGVFTNDWTISCPMAVVITPIVPIVGTTGNAIYMITYQGGYVTLGGPGNPWDGGDAVYTGVIDTYTEMRTIQYVSGKITGATSDHSVNAHIQGYPESCVTWGIGNGVLRGGDAATGQTPFPFLYFNAQNQPVLQSVKGNGYPGYPIAGCALSPAGPGHWDDIRDLTISITGCALATEPTTWGAVKAKYRD
jgi:hypothetical protein